MRFKDDVFVSCLKYCKNREDAQDILQDTFLHVFKNIKTYKGSGTFEGWVKRIAINKSITKYKNERHLELIKDNTLNNQSEDDPNIERIPLNQILKYIQELPSQYRFVFNLYELDDYSHKEVAEILNISVSTSKSNLHRAKHLLRERIKKPTRTNPNKIRSNGN